MTWRRGKFFEKKNNNTIRMSFREINPQHHRFWLSVKILNKSWGNGIVRRFLQGIWYHTQRKNEANATSIWCRFKHYYCYKFGALTVEWFQIFSSNTNNYICYLGGARSVMVIVVGNGPRRHEFKSWTTLIAFHVALIPLERYESNYSPSSYG